MHYIDTRGLAPHVEFGEVLLAGTAPGGGLYVPTTYPQIGLELVRRVTYPQLAAYIIHLFVAGVIPFGILNKIAHEVYVENVFGTKEITPIEWLEPDLGLLQLSNGPTLAFKDLAMKIVARIMDYLLEQQGRRVAVVVSTSGDTGGAAVDAFAGCSRVDLFVLYPEGRTSKVQQLMMTTSRATNVHAIAVKGTFDDCQAMTKQLFSDKVFSREFGLTGVNSINWARIMAQVVYWVSCAVQVLNRGGKELMVSVPSGNFGDALSAYIAREMGMPIKAIIVATNQNDVLHWAFETGIYKKGAKVLPSSSPSMDIQVGSNFERFLFDRAGRNGTRIVELYAEFDATGRCDVSDLLSGLGQQWRSGCASEAHVESTIRYCYEKYGRIIDPHTAVGMFVGLDHAQEGIPLIVAETAKPEKFPDAIKRAIGVDLDMPEAWKHLETLPERIHRTGVDVEEVKRFIATYVQ